MLVEEILHQLRLVVYSIIYNLQGYVHPRWCRISSVNSMELGWIEDFLTIRVQLSPMIPDNKWDWCNCLRYGWGKTKCRPCHVRSTFLLPNVPSKSRGCWRSWPSPGRAAFPTLETHRFWWWDFLLPSRELTYPTLGKGKSSSKVPFLGDILVPWRVPSLKCRKNFLQNRGY